MKTRILGTSILSIVFVGLSFFMQSKLRVVGAAPTVLAPLPHFSDVTETTGVYQLVSIMTWGASWGDFNGDGFPDLFAGNHNSLPGLFRNNGDGTFTNIRKDTPLDIIHDRHGAAWGDYDNDGDQDLMIVAGGQKGQGAVPNELYRNDGDEEFVNIAEEAGVSDATARSRSGSWGDYDKDGDLDFFVATNLRPEDEQPCRLWRNNGDGTFTDVAADAGVAASQGLFAGGFVDYDFDGWPDVFLLGDPNRLFHNNRDGTFDDLTADTGFADQSAIGYAWGDYDADGDLDLFMGSGSSAVDDHIEVEEARVLFIGDVRGDQDGFDLEVAGSEVRFELDIRSPGVICDNQACIHIGAEGKQPTTNPFDVGAEGYGMPSYEPGADSGYYIWRDEGTDLWHVRWSESSDWKRNYAGIVSTHFAVTSVVPIDMEDPTPPDGRGWLWRNDGDGSFSKLSAEVGLDALGNYRSANWVDFDNDGWLDLFVADQGNLQHGNGPNHLFHNKGDGTFEDVGPLVGIVGTTEGGTNVSAWADYDRNGFLDLFTENGGFGGQVIGKWPFNKGPHQMLRNEGNSNHWLQLELVGKFSNREGLGAVVQVKAGGRTQIQTHTDGSVAKCQDGSSLHFGLGQSTLVDSIIIHWPSGIRQILTDVAVDQQLTIIETQTNFDAKLLYFPVVVK
jgi:hypothetical protein